MVVTIEEIKKLKEFFDLHTGHTFDLREAGEQPVPVDMPGVKGIFLGGCVREGVGSSLDSRGSYPIAHTHIGNIAEKRWICYRNPVIYRDPAYEYVRWHEYAHVLANQGHTDKWRRIMQSLGQPIPPMYARRSRKKPINGA